MKKAAVRAATAALELFIRILKSHAEYPVVTALTYLKACNQSFSTVHDVPDGLHRSRYLLAAIRR